MFEPILTIYRETGGFLLSWWWLWLPIVLFLILKHLWLSGLRQEFVQRIDWILLEVSIPREIKKTPKAMEQIFAGLHGIQTSPNFRDRNFYGYIPEWFSFEIASFGGSTHFFIWTLAKYRDLVEAQIYAQYPEAEINEVDDYTQLVPPDIPNQNYELWGAEFILTKPDFYPIRTYPAFEQAGAEEQIDPIASLLEVLSKLNPQEQIWIQTLIRPIGEEWRREGKRYIDRKLGRRKGGLVDEFSEFLEDFRDTLSDITSPRPKGMAREPRKRFMVGPTLPRRFRPDWEQPFQPGAMLTEPEQNILIAIENNIAKLGFETIIRFIYLAPTEIFSRANIAAIVGCYKQFNTQDLNGFQINPRTSSEANYFFRKTKEFYKKKTILADYKKRFFPPKSKYIKYLKPKFSLVPFRPRCFVFNIEELATVYHYPGMMVVAPLIPKIEARKAKPPVGLPMQPAG